MDLVDRVAAMIFCMDEYHIDIWWELDGTTQEEHRKVASEIIELIKEELK